MAAGYSAAGDLRNKLAVKAARAARPGVLMTGPDGQPLQTMAEATNDIMPAGMKPVAAPSLMMAGTPTNRAYEGAQRPGGASAPAWTPPSVPPGDPGMGPPNPNQQMDDRRRAIGVRDAMLVRQGMREKYLHGQSPEFGAIRDERFALGDEKYALENATKPVQQPQGPAQIAGNRESLFYQGLGNVDSLRQRVAVEPDPQKKAAMIAEANRMETAFRSNLAPYQGGPENPEVSRIHDAQAAAVPGQEADRNAWGERAGSIGGINQASEKFRIESMVNRAAVARANQEGDLARAKYEGSPEMLKNADEMKRIQQQIELGKIKGLQAAGQGPASPGAAMGREQQRQSGISQVYGSEGAMQQKVQEGTAALHEAVQNLDSRWGEGTTRNAANKYSTTILPDIQRYAAIDPVGAAQVARQHLAEIQRTIHYNPLGPISNEDIQQRRQTHLARIEAELTRIASAGG